MSWLELVSYIDDETAGELGAGRGAITRPGSHVLHPGFACHKLGTFLIRGPYPRGATAKWLLAGKMRSKWRILAGCLVLLLSIISKASPDKDFSRMTTDEIIRSEGYPVESHNITTKDGYILTVSRIPHGRDCSSDATRPAVLLQHGLLASSADWVINGVNESLGLILADHGHDVWLGNNRGNRYSRNHTKLDVASKEFWSFSWSEMAEFDLPAMVEYICAVTYKENLYYVGQSQGTLIGFTGFSLNQELARRIKLFVALAPVYRVGNIRSPIKYLTLVETELEALFRLARFYEFLPDSVYTEWLAKLLCRGVTWPFCREFIFLLSGFDPDQLNKTRVPIYLAHTPAGTSTMDIVHFAQMVRSGKCRKFDFGYLENILHYGQFTPPMYSLESMTVPTVLVSGENDYLADQKDIQFIRENLRSVIEDKVIPKWDHLDFIWGMDAPELVYFPLLELLRMFQ